MAVPTLVVEFSTDAADDPTPTWVDVTAAVRAFSTNRGRDSELSRVDAGTATVVLSNADRSFDPTDDPTLRPMNRWRISAALSGGDEPVFMGYAESYEQQWPAYGKDAVTVVSLVDEFKVLSLEGLPTTDPPRDSYQDLIMFDEPSAYWPMGTEANQLSQAAVVGPVLQAPNGISFTSGQTGTPPIGELAPYIILQLSFWLRSQDIEPVDTNGLDPGNLTELTYELWYMYSGLPTAQEWVVRGPTTNSGTSWALQLDTDGSLTATVRNSSGTSFVNDSAVLTADTWYHIVCTITAATFRLYVNGTQVDSVAFTGSFSSITTPASLTVGNQGVSIGASKFRSYNNVAFYRYGLTAARVLAHFDAGANRGFVIDQNPGDRIDDVLDASSSIAARSIRTGTRNVIGRYMRGQAPLEEMRIAETAENVDAVLFTARDGTITFLDDGHRSVSPWDTVQATFDDDGTDTPYQDIKVDYSDSFLANAWNVTKTGGTVYSVSDATSIGEFLKRSQSITDLPVTTTSDAEDVADALLAKYKDPLTRITELAVVTKNATIANTVIPLEIGDRIRVFRSPPGGGTRIDQTLFVQRISIDGRPGEPWSVRLGVSPL